jgi:hypothetical protein
LYPGGEERNYDSKTEKAHMDGPKTGVIKFPGKELFMPQPIEEYVKQSDRLAQEMVNTYCAITMAGNGATLTPEFNEVFELTCEFRQAKRAVESKRLAFAHAFKRFRENHEA